MPFSPIPGGSFLMGSEAGQEDERPVHRVHVDAFEMSVYPVTRGEYATFIDETGHERPRLEDTRRGRPRRRRRRRVNDLTWPAGSSGPA